MSTESSKALEWAILKQTTTCFGDCFVWIYAFVYSVFLLAFKQHRKAPLNKVNAWVFGYSLFLSLEIVLSAFVILKCVNPLSNVLGGVGLPFLFLLPFVTVLAPFYGLFSLIGGSVDLMKTYQSMNVTMVLINYPATMLYLYLTDRQSSLIPILILLSLNKMMLSLFGAKVRQNFANPCFAKNQLKMREHLSDLMTE